jgi:hypothetical protein
MLRNKEKEQRSLDNDVTSVESEQDLTPPCRNIATAGFELTTVVVIGTDYIYYR